MSKTNILSSIRYGMAWLFLLVFAGHVHAQDANEQAWVNAHYQKLSVEERIAQLIMVRAQISYGETHLEEVQSLIENYKIGGIILFAGEAEEQLRWVNRYQSASSDIPLLVAMDAENGVGFRLKEQAISYPQALTLGAVQNNSLLYEMGTQVGTQLRRLGVHINFAPVLDINNNAANPVINTRSYGEDRYNVTSKSMMYLKGMQDRGVMACAKHFPGHGDTNVDSHLDLPLIPHDRHRLDSLELYPYATLIRGGLLQAVMVAHLHVPVLDDRPNRPTSLSRNSIRNLLVDSLGFQGLVMTDAMEMKGVSKHFERGVADAEALVAGNDVLLIPGDVAKAIEAVKQYISEGKLAPSELEAKVKKVLAAKYRLGLHGQQPLEEEGLLEDLRPARALALQEKLYAEALTLVRNAGQLLPLSEAADYTPASVVIGGAENNLFQTRLEHYRSMDHFRMPGEMTASEQQVLLEKLGDKDVVIVGLHGLNKMPQNNFGIAPSSLQFLRSLNRQTRVVLVIFGYPYSLSNFDDFENVVMAYEDNAMTQDLSAQAIFGAIPFRGRLPVTASAKSHFNAGLMTRSLPKLGFSLPENVGINADSLKNIDRIAMEAIEAQATPGCVVLVAKDGKIVYEKAFGYQTYARQRPIHNGSIYDLASVTKVAASTLAVMKLYQDGQVDLDASLCNYIPELDTTNKADLTLRELMAHRAGLKPWIPFYTETVQRSRRGIYRLPDIYSQQPHDDFTVPVSASLFINSDYLGKIWEQIFNSDLRTPGKYVYSDLGFYLIKPLVEHVTGQNFEDYLQENFYEQLGLRHTRFNPWRHFPVKEVVPTEKDSYFRGETVQGFVHDMGAAMLGGVSGHAGLFSSAGDLAVIMQMLLNGGIYGNKRYLNADIVRAFTSRVPNESRRGIGFDLFELNSDRSPNMGSLASPSTFGHLGFTGTAVWADPEYNLIFIFLSNRTYPSMNNNKLIKMDIRPRMQDAIYRALMPQPEAVYMEE